MINRKKRNNLIQNMIFLAASLLVILCIYVDVTLFIWPSVAFRKISFPTSESLILKKGVLVSVVGSKLELTEISGHKKLLQCYLIDKYFTGCLPSAMAEILPAKLDVSYFVIDDGTAKRLIVMSASEPGMKEFIRYSDQYRTLKSSISIKNRSPIGRAFFLVLGVLAVIYVVNIWWRKILPSIKSINKQPLGG